jgi:hypothetical protein
MAAHGEQELVLGARDADGLGLFFAPVQEAAQAIAEREESLEVAIGQGRGSTRHVVSR